VARDLKWLGSREKLRHRGKKFLILPWRGASGLLVAKGKLLFKSREKARGCKRMVERPKGGLSRACQKSARLYSMPGGSKGKFRERTKTFREVQGEEKEKGRSTKGLM